MSNMGNMKSRRISRKVPKTPSQPNVVREAAAHYGQASYTATEAKQEFGRLLDEAIHGKTVVITRHDSPRAVLISMDRFNELQDAPLLKLNTLSDEFDALLDKMQTPAARRGMSSAFGASPKELGKAAAAASRKRG